MRFEEREDTAVTLIHIQIRQHTSAYVSIRQHTSAYVSICQHLSNFEEREDTAVD
jgi:hypothetical protein